MVKYYSVEEFLERGQVEDACPGAFKIWCVPGGWYVFQTPEDYAGWVGM